MQRWRQERLNDELVAAADESAVGETETDGRARPRAVCPFTDTPLPQCRLFQ